MSKTETGDQEHTERAALVQDLSDFLTAITGHAEALIASLDPAGPGGRDAHAICRLAQGAARVTGQLRTLESRAAVAIDPGSTPAPGGADRTAAERRSTALVLVVEDEPGMRELLKAILGRAGHKVVTATGPRAALDLLARQPAISLMLVDVVMPEMDGYELAAEARKARRGLPVVFMSGFAPEPSRLPRGDAFVAKPFTSESLSTAVNAALSR